MPGYNGTGPMGMGPRTGGGRGLCGPAGNRMGDAPLTGRGGRGPRGFRNMYRATDMPGWRRWQAQDTVAMMNPYPHSTGDEASMLKEQAAALKDQLNAIEERLNQITSKDDPSK